MTPLKHYFTKGLDEHCFPCVCEVVYLGSSDGKVLFRTMEGITTTIPCEHCDFNDELIIARQCADDIKEWESKCGEKANCQLRRTHPYLFT